MILRRTLLSDEKDATATRHGEDLSAGRVWRELLDDVMRSSPNMDMLHNEHWGERALDAEVPCKCLPGLQAQDEAALPSRRECPAVVKTGLRGGGCTPSTRRSLHIQGMDRDEKLGLSSSEGGSRRRCCSSGSFQKKKEDNRVSEVQLEL